MFGFVRQVGKYKYVANAIRRGIAMYPNRTHKTFDRPNQASCALGAMIAGGVGENDISNLMWLRIGWKHDVRNWSRERVADWLETL